MSLDKFKEHIAEDEVKSEEAVAEEAKTDTDFQEVVEAEEQTAEVVDEAKKAKVSESEDEADEDEEETVDEANDDDEEGEDLEEKVVVDYDGGIDTTDPDFRKLVKKLKGKFKVTGIDPNGFDEVKFTFPDDAAVQKFIKMSGIDILHEDKHGDDEDMDETADMTKTQLQASAMKMIKAMKKDELAAGYKAMKASYDPAKKEVGVNTPEQKEETAVSEDVEVMFAGSDLSEDFKAKAQTIFEAAVTAKASEQIVALEEAQEQAIAEGVEAVKSELTEKVDSYLDYVVEQWMKDNEIAIEKGLKAELVEDFLGGLKNLFMEHYIDVPEEKVDVLDEQATEIEELKAKLAEQIEAGVEQKKILDTFAAQEVLSSVSEGLTDTEADKVSKLAEGVEFVDADQYREKLETIKESYFPKVKATGGNPEDNVSEVSIETSDAMAAYAQALSRMKKG